MSSPSASRILVLSIAVVALGTITALSCGSVTPAADGGSSGAAGSSAGGSTGMGGSGVGGTTGTGGGGVDAGPITCRVDVPGDCPQNFTCACGGPGPIGTCTCHRNCSSASDCGAAEPMCGCSPTSGSARFCVNACFCTCG